MREHRTRVSRWLWSLACGALCAGFAAAWPTGATAQCVGDCDGSGEVTVNEIIVMVNIALGTQQLSACPVADPNGDGEVTVNEIIQAVNNALNGCPPPSQAVCGNATVEAGEECDNGGICIGSSRAGQSCTKDDDCFAGSDDRYGVCTEGPKIGTRCNVDDANACPGGQCVACRTFGGDGCAANCTNETSTTFSLVPGTVSAAQDLVSGSGAVVWGDPLKIGLELRGSQTVIAGKEKDGKIPVVVPAASVNFPAIPISTLACACVRGLEYKTCGGTIFNEDGSFTPQCTEGFGATPADCAGEGLPPCTAVHGPGNTASGIAGCNGLSPINYTVRQNSDIGGGENGPVQLQFEEASSGGPGSVLLANSLAIGTKIGGCEGFCTDADPASSRGTPQTLLFTTGQACGQVENKNNFPDPGTPKCVQGQPVSCSQLSQGTLTGLKLGGAFTALDQPTLGDIEVTNILEAQ